MDVNHDPITYSIFSYPSLGFITNFNSTKGSFTYIPNQNVNGTDHFTFKASDGKATSIGTGNVFITINQLNDAPFIINQTAQIYSGDTVQIRLQAFDPEQQPLRFSVVDQPRYGSLTDPIADSPTSALVTYKANSLFNGNDTFTFEASDGVLDSPKGTVTILSFTPIADNSNATTDEDTTVRINLTGHSIPRGNNLTFSLSGSPSNGKLLDPITRLPFGPSDHVRLTSSTDCIS